MEVKPRRSFFRFGLWQVGIFMALVGLGLAYFASPVSHGLRPTGRELDIAILGTGYYQVKQFNTGKTGYTRNGILHLYVDGTLNVGTGPDRWLVQPAISVPMGHTWIRVERNGRVQVGLPDTDEAIDIGRLELSYFMNEEGLREVALGIYAETDDSGSPHIAYPGQVGLGLLQQGWLEDTSPRWPIQLAVALTLIVITVLCYFASQLRQLRAQLEEVIARLPPPPQPSE